MKKNIFFIALALVVMSITSCQTEEQLTPSTTFNPEATGDNPEPGTGGTTGGGTTGGGTTGGGTTGGGTGGGTNITLPVGPVPANFTKKVVLEENTGEWCGWCPYGAEIMEQNIADNPGKVIGIAVHDGDFMEVSAYNNFQRGLTGVTGYPQGSVDRGNAASRSLWTSQINTNLAKTAELGIAMESTESGNLIDLDVYIGYNAPITQSTKLTVAIIENDVPQSSGGQAVYAASSGSLKPLPAGWVHSHVFRGIITSAFAGDDISLNSADGYTKVSFSQVDLSAYSINDKANVHIVAFIHDNTGTRDVLNAQEVSLNELKAWD